MHWSVLRSFVSSLAMMGALCFPTTPAGAQDLLQSLDVLGQGGGGLLEELQVVPTLTTNELKPGATVVFALEVILPPQFYIYSTSPSFGGGTQFELTAAPGLELVDEVFQADRKPKVVLDEGLNQKVEKFYDRVVWWRRFKIREDADLDKILVQGTMTGQYCSADPKNGKCIPIRPPREYEAQLAVGEPPQAVATLLAPHAAPSRPTKPEDYQRTLVPQRRGRPDPVEFSFALTPHTAQAGDEVTLTVTAKLQDGWHTFALDHDPEMIGEPTVIEATTQGLSPIEPWEPSEPPHIERLEDLDVTQRLHYKTISWTQRYQVDAGVEPGQFEAQGSVRYQLCDARSCIPAFTQEFALGLAAIPSDSAAPPPALAPEQTPDEAETETSGAAPANDLTQQGLLAFLLTAAVFGFAALLTPCVFPMVPITVSLFLKQSEKEHHRPVLMASVYCLSIVAAFTTLGVLISFMFGAAKITEFANNVWLNLGIACVLVFFGMNLLGLFEIRIPSSLLTWSSKKEGQGGMIGVVFMALTFVLVSFTCTFAFVGGLAVVAAKGDFYWPILGMLAFSAAFALPFFFLALFPSMLQRLPKSGGWMNTVKVTMGMVEVAAAIKFLSVADNPGPILFDYSFVMASWMVILVCLGMYLLGIFRLSHDTPAEGVTALRFSFAMFFLTFGAYLAIGVFGAEQPKGALWDKIASFAPAVFETGQDVELGPIVDHDGLVFALDFDAATKYAKAKNQLLFLDFTGVNCQNCRLMERRMAEEHNRERLEGFVRVQLYTDRVPPVHDVEVASMLDRNQKLQEEWFQDVSLPAYAVVTPDGKQVLSRYIGFERNKGEFAEFLDEGLKRWSERPRISQTNVVSKLR